MGTYIIRKRGNEMYIIRKHKVEYEDIIAGRLNTIMIKGRCMQVGECIRFVEIDTAGNRTGREAFCDIEHIFERKDSKKQLIKYRKRNELRELFSKAKAREARRKKAKSAVR